MQGSPEFAASLKELLGDPVDLVFAPAGEGVTVAFLSTLVEISALETHLLGPLRRAFAEGAKAARERLLPFLSMGESRPRNDLKKIASDLLAGHAVVHMAGNDTVYSFAATRPLRWPPTPPQIERTIRGTRLSFPESLEESIRLVRTRIKDPSLSASKGFPSAGGPGPRWPSSTWPTWPTGGSWKKSAAGFPGSRSMGSWTAATWSS
ncbi:MAG: spore germination protein [Bacillota bacterium]